MFVYNDSVRKVFEEEMDLNYDLSSDYFQNIWTIWIDILLNKDIILNLARTQDFHPFLDLAWTQDFTHGNLESWLTTIFVEKILESWLTLKFQKLKSWILLDWTKFIFSYPPPPPTTKYMILEQPFLCPFIKLLKVSKP